jgi:hypothetical protein
VPFPRYKLGFHPMTGERSNRGDSTIAFPTDHRSAELMIKPWSDSRSKKSEIPRPLSPQPVALISAFSAAHAS